MADEYNLTLRQIDGARGDLCAIADAASGRQHGADCHASPTGAETSSLGVGSKADLWVPTLTI